MAQAKNAFIYLNGDGTILYYILNPKFSLSDGAFIFTSCLETMGGGTFQLPRVKRVQPAPTHPTSGAVLSGGYSQMPPYKSVRWKSPTSAPM